MRTNMTKNDFIQECTIRLLQSMATNYTVREIRSNKYYLTCVDVAEQTAEALSHTFDGFSKR